MDLYEQWLDIPAGTRPPDHYSLLGLPRFEADTERIRRAARERMKKARPLCLKLPEDGTRLLNEIATAQVCLLDPQQRAQYDRELAAPAGGNGVQAVPWEPAPNRRGPFHVGIELGREYAALAFVDGEGHVEAVWVDDRLRIATAVYFKGPDEILVGDTALHFIGVAPGRVARSFQPALGATATVIEADGRSYRAEELAALVLRKLLAAATETIGPVERAVISVPLNFTEQGREAVRQAGQIAGLEEVELVEESVAAAVAYGHTLAQAGGFVRIEQVAINETVLVVELGETRLEATVIRLRPGGSAEVIAKGGDDHLGTENWDDVLFGMLVERYEALTGHNPSSDVGLMRALRRKAVKAGEELDELPRAEIRFSHDGLEHVCVIPRSYLELRARPLIVRAQATLEDLLRQNNLTWRSIDRALLPGAASRTRLVSKTIESCARRQLSINLPPDVAVVKGAALTAARRGLTISTRPVVIESAAAAPVAPLPSPAAVSVVAEAKTSSTAPEIRAVPEAAIAAAPAPLPAHLFEFVSDLAGQTAATTAAPAPLPAPPAAAVAEDEWEQPDPEVLAPGDAGLNGLLGWALSLAEGGEFTEAYNELDTAKRSRPGSPEQYHVRARVLLLQDEPALALKENRKAMAIEPTAPVCFLHAECLLALGRPAEAADLAREGLARDSRSRGRHLLARCYEMEGLNRDAAAECEIAWQLATLVERDRAAAARIAVDLERLRAKVR